MITMEKITVIVPVYKAERWLRRCVDSILAQTHTDIEMLLVDDGSPDGSGAICDDYAKAHKRVKAIHKPNGGVSSARNVGLQAATGEYVVFVDSDDRIRPDTLEILLKYKDQYSADCVVCGLTQDSGSLWAADKLYFYSNISDFKKELPKWIDSELLACPVNKLFRRDLITKKFREDMGFGEDLVFSLDYLCNCKKIVFIPDTLYLHNNLNEGSIVHNYNPKRLQDIESFENRILEFYGEGKDNNIHAKYVRDISNHLFDLISQTEVSLADKKHTIASWYNKSRLKSLKTIPFSRVHWKKKLLIHALRYGCIMPYSRLVLLKQKLG